MQNKTPAILIICFGWLNIVCGLIEFDPCHPHHTETPGKKPGFFCFSYSFLAEIPLAQKTGGILYIRKLQQKIWTEKKIH